MLVTSLGVCRWSVFRPRTRQVVAVEMVHAPVVRLGLVRRVISTALNRNAEVLSTSRRQSGQGPRAAFAQTYAGRCGHHQGHGRAQVVRHG